MDKAAAGALRDLLLRKLPPEQAEPLENSVVQDEGVADQLELAGDDLLLDYARGQLHPDDATRVEKYLLATPLGPQRLAFARALAQHSDAASLQPNLVGRFSGRRQRRVWLGAMAATVLLSVSALIWRVAFLHAPAAPPLASQALGPPSGPLAPSLTAAPSEAAALTTFTVALLASQVRGTEEAPVLIPASTTQVRIQCEIPRPRQVSSYRLALSDSSGRVQLSLDNLPLRQADDISFVEAQIAAEHFSAGHYRVSIFLSVTGSMIVARDFEVRRTSGH